MRQHIDTLWKRILLIIGRGRVSLTDDTGSVQTMQLTMQGLSVHDDVPRLAEYGYSSNPPAGTDALMVKLGGDHSQGVVVATNHQASRLKGLPVGASALYDNAGAKVVLNADGTLSITAETSVTVTAPTVTIVSATAIAFEAPTITLSGAIVLDGPVTSGTSSGAGPVSLTGPLAVTNNITSQGKSVGGHHTHPNGTPNTGVPN